MGTQRRCVLPEPPAPTRHTVHAGLQRKSVWNQAPGTDAESTDYRHERLTSQAECPGMGLRSIPLVSQLPRHPKPWVDGESGGFESRLGHEFARVRLHANGVVQRQLAPSAGNPLDDPRVHPAGAPKATTCSPPTWCPKSFCQPYSSESYAIHMRTKMLPGLMAGIALAVDSRVVPLWHAHLLGGSGPKNLTSEFGSDFTNSRTTMRTTDFLAGELKKSLEAAPPVFPSGVTTVTLDIGSRISSAIADIGDPVGVNQMNFDIPNEVPGNIAGGIGKDQLTCMAGAKPSPLNDERKAEGTATVTQEPGGSLSIQPSITYTVKDTIDLCPGDCGGSLEQIATVPISQFEATGISGDIPFTVTFPANAPAFTIPAPVPVVVPPPKTP
jgi:hypothetical protein